MKRRPRPPGRAAQLLRARDGRFTAELRREPGGFGLGQLPSRLKPDATTTLVCGYCSTGCGLSVHLKQGAAINLSPAPDYPVNLGMACPKGWEALTPLGAEDRAVTPLLRERDGAMHPIGWPAALDQLVRRFKAIRAAHGPQALAFLGTGQMPIEEIALFGALCKLGMGMAHGDSNTRQCMSTSVAAYKECFGFDAPPYSYADLEQSDLLVFIGANPCIAHPILWQRVTRNRRRPKVVVIDPRRTETAEAASLHLPVRPKGDLALLQGVAHVLLRAGWIDRDFIEAHTSDFDRFAAQVADWPPARAAAESGVPAERIEELARLIHEHERVSFWWTMGVNQSHQGTRTAQAIIALALMTGQIGRPGTGPNSITGQCNAMGSRLFAMTGTLPAGRSFEDAEDRAEMARLFGVDEARIPTRPSWAYDRIMDGIDRGEIRGLWIVATNTAHSWIDQARARERLAKLDFLVVQDMYTSTDTARLAHLVLPAAGWGEKDGVFINSERRLGLIKQVSRAPGQALSDFRIFQLVAGVWGCGELFQRWKSPEAVFELLRESTRGRPCDFTGVGGYAFLDQHGGVQWPFPEGASLEAARGERRLFEDGRFYTDDGRARFVADEPRPLPEPADPSYPFTLLTGRGSSSQWHTETRTGKSAVLRQLAPPVAYVEVHPQDAAAIGVGASDWVRVSSRRGAIELRAMLTTAVPRGCVFVPMHYARSNQLTHAIFDPQSRQPAYKAGAVALTRMAQGT